MLSSRLFWKIFLAYTALLLGSAGVFVVTLSPRQQDLAFENVQKRLHDSAVLLRNSMQPVFREGPSPELQSRLARLGRENQTRFTLIAEDGTVLGDSDENPAQMDNHSDRPEIQAARRNGLGIRQRESATLGHSFMYYALPVQEEGRLLGFVRVAIPMERIHSQITGIKSLIWGTAGIVCLVTLAFTYSIVGRIIRPLESLTQAAEGITRGDLRQKLEITSRDEIGALGHAFNLMSDELQARIEELQQRTKEFEESNERLSTVLEGMIEGVVAVDNSERILFANNAAQSLLELGKNGFVGRPIWEAVRNSKIQEIVQRTLSVRKQQAPVELELPRTQSVVAVRATRLSGDPCPGTVLVLQNITELRRLENVRREFVSNVSHELKTPLTSIQAYAETLLDGAIDEPRFNRDFVQRIEEQAERLHTLILDLLSLARIESGQEVFDLTNVSLSDSIEECVEEHAAIAEANEITLATDPPRQNLSVFVDSEGLRTILDNLVDNAIKYTPSGGRVIIRWKAEGTMAVVEVEDTGMGIAQENLARIFERFYRVDKARSRQVGGTGLGLSIVKHLVQVFQGRVEVNSELGKGTTFSVYLPLAPQ